MKMLESIAMLNYLLGKLEAGKRTLVPIAVYDELKTVLIPLYKKVAAFSNEQTQFQLTLLMEAVNLVSLGESVQFIPDTAREALIEGVENVKESICLQAYDYYKFHDFEPTNTIIPLMREVVRAAAMKGVM